MEQQTVQPAAQKEVHIPWYVIAGVMLVVTAIIIAVFAGPLNTSPEQKFVRPANVAK